MLDIKDLHAAIGGNEILRGLSLAVGAGEVHAIMGPNGSGKSTLAQVIAGHEDYEVTSGTVRYEGRDLLDLAPEERARAGIFLGFQYPVEIPGVNNAYLLKAAVNAKRQHEGKDGHDKRAAGKSRSQSHSTPLLRHHMPLQPGNGQS